MSRYRTIFTYQVAVVKQRRWWVHYYKALFTLRTTPYVDACMWTRGDIRHRTLMQNTADAKLYATIVVNGSTVMDGNATQHVAMIIFLYF